VNVNADIRYRSLKDDLCMNYEVKYDWVHCSSACDVRGMLWVSGDHVHCSHADGDYVMVLANVGG